MLGPLGKGTVEETEVNTEVFKAHSVRGAATLAALDKEAHFSDILSTVDWSQKSTF